MLRCAVPSDTPLLIALAIETGMFLPSEVEPLQDILDGFHAGRSGTDHRLEVWCEEEKPVGVVYFGPDPMTDRKWDLWMIAVSPSRQRTGIGSALIRFTETHAQLGGGRLMIIETSTQSKYDATRVFYKKHGYAEVARIPDYYTDGDGKVICTKRLN